MTQSIIVYRNPAEQAFWEGGFAVPIVGGCLVGLVAFILSYQIASMLFQRFGRSIMWGRRNSYSTTIASILGITAGISTLVYLL